MHKIPASGVQAVKDYEEVLQEKVFNFNYIWDTEMV